MRISTAVLALLLLSKISMSTPLNIRTHKQPRPKRAATAILVCRLFRRFQTIAIGRMPRVKSHAAVKTLYTYAMEVMTLRSRQLPCPSGFQTWETGRHWRSRINHVIRPMVRVTMIARNKTILCDLSTVTRSIVMAIDTFPAMHVNIYITSHSQKHCISLVGGFYISTGVVPIVLWECLGDISLFFFPMPYPTPIKEDIDRAIFSP